MNHIEKAEAVFKTLAQLARETWKRKESEILFQRVKPISNGITGITRSDTAK